ncbi:hypothetical protein THAOC_05876 [Thalassiosira oceanica]|uniref:Uncharacterized protein n=1 Tax=Thalassiosira oceanica TaxID=159749 RepID=K0TMC2_THAOC|nr:hypothetical protein THAOC_05876 [Thalassiosira oceanica]|eukprot:EJK72582.1 hypothetical protein THAOC_05876 [Thalassiosira oceanica]
MAQACIVVRFDPGMVSRSARSISHNKSRRMKDTTAISLLLALAPATLTASSACVNPGSIGSKGECVNFCQGAVWAACGARSASAHAPGAETACPRARTSRHSPTTSTASPKTDQRPNDSGKDPNAESAPALDGFTFVGMGKCVNKNGMEYIHKKMSVGYNMTALWCAGRCRNEAERVDDTPNYAISMVGFEWGGTIAYEHTKYYSEYACLCLTDVTTRYQPDSKPLGPIANVETIDNNGVEPYCYSYDAYSPVTLAPTQQPSYVKNGQSSVKGYLGRIKVGLIVASVLMVV